MFNGGKKTNTLHNRLINPFALYIMLKGKGGSKSGCLVAGLFGTVHGDQCSQEKRLYGGGNPNTRTQRLLNKLCHSFSNRLHFGFKKKRERGEFFFGGGVKPLTCIFRLWNRSAPFLTCSAFRKLGPGMDAKRILWLAAARDFSPPLHPPSPPPQVTFWAKLDWRHGSQ